jgi:hypothetical protein
VKPTPRKRRLAFAHAAALLLACNSTAPAFGTQQGDPRPAAQRAPAVGMKQPAKSAPDSKERAQRESQQAVATINEAADSARAVENPHHRVVILADAADALWPFDEQGARALFARAWETAAAFDKEQADAFDRNPPGQNTSGAPASSGDVPEAFTEARQEVVAVASRHDARLTERCLRELRESVESRRSKDGQRKDDPASRYNLDDSFFSAFDFDQLRLNLSRSLVEDGDYKQAAEVAAPEIAGGVNSALVRFLIQFRESAPAEADALYLRLLEKTASDPNAGVNDVLLLSSYVLTPTMLAAVDERGSVNFNPVYRGGGTEPTPAGTTKPPAANIRRLFFNTAAAALLRPPAPRPADAQGASGASAALFVAVTRLLPFFEREAPQFAPQLYARQQALAAELGAASRDSLSRLAKTDKLARDNPTDPLGNDLDYVKQVPSAESRDEMRNHFVARAARLKLWDRARTAASEIEDADKRAAALRLIAAYQVASIADAFADDEDGDERAAQFVQGADVRPAIRALGYARVALLAARENHKARAAELLGRAQSFAEQTDFGTEERVTALIVVAATAAQLDEARAWAVVPAVVRAANEVKDVSPDEISGSFRAPHLSAGEGEASRASSDPFSLDEGLEPFRLDVLFATLAEHDFKRALAQARRLTSETTGALVRITAARAALEKSSRGSQPRAGASQAR